MDRKYIFIVGVGRSGTKFLMNILNNSPYVHIAPEIHYFSSIVHNGFLKNLRKQIKTCKKLTIDEVVNCLMCSQHFGTYWRRNIHFSIQEIRKWFEKREINEKNVYEFIIEHDYLLNGRDKKRLKYIGEKTPSNVFHVKQLYEWFPDSTMLFLYRNPIDVIRSEVNKDHKPDYPVNRGSVLYASGLVAYVVFVWFVAAVIGVYYKLTRKDSFYVAAYEDLNLHVEDTVKRICSKIEIPYTRDLCTVQKVDSSYLKGEDQSHWYPPKWVSLIYTILLSPLRIVLDKVSLRP